VLLGCGLLAVVAVPLIAIVAAIAIPSMLASRRSSLETNAVGSCLTYAAAQTMFQRNDWDGDKVLEYADDLSALCNTPDSSGNPISLIDTAFASAKGPGGLPRHGYLFQEMTAIAGQPIDWTTDFALCAVPAVYGRTGYRTFIVKTDGTVYGKDQGPGGTFVTDYPADLVSEDWIIAE
jgi:type II secretory pathway pseudopilin PulG